VLDFYHCTPDSTRYLKHAPNQLNILASAYRIKKFPAIKKHINLARQIMIDSGMISAMKKGEVAWLDTHDWLISLAEEIKPDYIVALDCPSEPGMLNKIGLNVAQARHRTLNNVEYMLGERRLPEQTQKMYVLQGWEINDYEVCIREFERLEVFQPGTIIGIGSVCMRRPNWNRTVKHGTKNKPMPVADLYEVCRYVREAVPAYCPVHCFGIGKPEWIRHLHGMGIDSFDSGTASISVAFNRGLCPILPESTHEFEVSDKSVKVCVDLLNFVERTAKDYTTRPMRSGWQLTVGKNRYTFRFRDGTVKVTLNERTGSQTIMQFACEMLATEKQLLEVCHANTEAANN